MNSTEMQYRAFLAVVAAALVVALAPIVVSGIRGEALPDGLISIADKSVVAFAGLLGTIGALLFRQNQVDERRAEATNETFRAVTAAATAAGPQPVTIEQPADKPVPVETT